MTKQLRERIAKLRLLRTERVGPIAFRQLMDRYRTAERVLEELPGLARRKNFARLSIFSRGQAESELEAVEKLGGQSIFLGEPTYPERLALIVDPPPVLHVLGKASLLRLPSLAVVGARNASSGGLRIAERFANFIAARRFCIVSGLARGVDAAAHTGALTTKNTESTIAVIAGGPDQIYPYENRDLRARIEELGAIVSEAPVGTKPLGRYFPRRNRVISGLSLGVLVIEATLDSGSLITAGIAADQGREVFAIPGSPLEPRSRGPNRLLREGAVLVETPQDLLEVLQPLAERPQTPESPTFAAFPPPPPDPQAEQIAKDELRTLISVVPEPLDTLLQRGKILPSVGRAALLEMELAGEISYEPGGTVCRRHEVESMSR